jgi:hypothetical protein
MRRGEDAGLKWSDLDRSTNRLSINRTLQSLAGKPVELPVKTRVPAAAASTSTRSPWRCWHGGGEG